MTRNYTRRNLRAGKPGKTSLKKNRKRTTAGLISNYEMMLQLYYLTKKETVLKRELKYEKIPAHRHVADTEKTSYSISARIGSFLNESLLLLKKLRPGIAMLTE